MEASFKAVQDRFRECFGKEFDIRGARRAWITLDAKDLLQALELMKSSCYTHLITITAIDAGEQFELLYHVVGPGGVVTLRTAIPRGKPEMPTASGIYISAAIYEREVHDLFGLVFTGHPDLRMLILPEGWPEGEYPMRKDWKDGGGADV